MRDDFGVDPGLASQIFQRQNDLRNAYRGSLQVGVELGRLLARAKSECRHGDFPRWLKQHFEGSARYAQHLMRLSEEYLDTIPQISLREALRLIAGKRSAQPPLPHERLSRRTVDRALKTIKGMAARAEKIDKAFRREGLAPQHDAAKLARALRAIVGAGATEAGR